MLAHGQEEILDLLNNKNKLKVMMSEIKGAKSEEINDESDVNKYLSLCMK